MWARTTNSRTRAATAVHASRAVPSSGMPDMYTYDQLIARARHLAGIGVLLGITLQGACGADSTGITPPGSSGGVPSALVGSWNEAAASGSQYCDPNGGGCTTAYGGSE